MYQKLYLLIACLILAGTFACTPETYEAPIPQERLYYRFVNLNNRADPIDVRLNSTDGLEWLGYDLKFEENKPGQGYSSVLINVDTFKNEFTNRDTSQYLFLEILDHRSQKLVVDPLELGTLGQGAGDLPQSWFFIDSFNNPILIRTNDDFESPKGGKAGIRFVNVNSNYVSVSLVIKESSTSIEQRNFLNSSRFFYPEAGVKTVYFVNDLAPGNGIIDSIPDVNLQAGRVYSFYFAQKENEPVVGYYILK
ncbi:MAG: hypothetical protein MRZ79_14275 [Bacteroidia bacterium]|nr:hypothetical protein [Bacteroidia bacterium]